MPHFDQQPLIQVSTTADLCDAVNDAIAKQRPLIDYGVAHEGVGHPPPEEHTKLFWRTATTNSKSPTNQQSESQDHSDQKEHGIIEHYERDLTVRVKASMTLGALQEQLAQTNQFLPIDADADITIGEIIHHNVYGPLRTGFGSIRDLLLGLHYVDGQGRDIHVGGRVVKNVAGLDVTRFMVGGLGQFGVIYEATIRTYAIPDSVFKVDIDINTPDQLAHRMTDFMLSDAKPTHISFSRRPGTIAGDSKGQWIGHLAYFGHAAAGLVHLRSLETLLDTFNGIHIGGSGSIPLAQDRSERSASRAWRRNASAVVKIITSPALTGELCSALYQWSQDNHPLHIDALPAHGCIFAGGDLGATLTERLDQGIGQLLQESGGMRIWHRKLVGTNNIEPFAPKQSDWPILAKLKKTMDPSNIFNPGRLF